MGIFFSRNRGGGDRPKKRKVDSFDKATLDIKVQKDKLKNYQKKIQVVIDRENEMAKQLMALKKKRQALLALKKRKYQESMLQQTEAQLQNIEEMINTMEFTKIESQVMEGLKAGNDVLKKLHEEMSIEDVEKIMEDTQDALDYQKEIDDLLGEALNPEELEEIEAELEALEQAEDAALEEKMPEVPTKAPEASETTEVEAEAEVEDDAESEESSESDIEVVEEKKRVAVAV